MMKFPEYLKPSCTPSMLDIFINRTEILRALKENLPAFSGTILDIGCGYMPYKSLVLTPPSRAEKYIGLDLTANSYQKPDLEWDGRTIPLEDRSVECVMATEVLEHCPEPEVVMREAFRVLKPGGQLFFTVPFLWPLHDIPHDEYRYTPYALERHLRNAAFQDIRIKALGGWDASLGQMIGLWVRRRIGSSWKRAILTVLSLPIVWILARNDRPPQQFDRSYMITGLSGAAIKPRQEI